MARYSMSAGKLALCIRQMSICLLAKEQQSCITLHFLHFFQFKYMEEERKWWGFPCEKLPLSPPSPLNIPI